MTASAISAIEADQAYRKSVEHWMDLLLEFSVREGIPPQEIQTEIAWLKKYCQSFSASKSASFKHRTAQRIEMLRTEFAERINAERSYISLDVPPLELFARESKSLSS